jgi:hypothetical protein
MTTWHDGDEDERAILNALLAEVMTGVNISASYFCPFHRSEQPRLHIYFHSRGPRRLGGVWVWCSTCGAFIHGTIHPPEWWENLEDLDLSHLTAEPEYLDLLAEKIDAHWVALLKRHTS